MICGDLFAHRFRAGLLFVALMGLVFGFGRFRFACNGPEADFAKFSYTVPPAVSLTRLFPRSCTSVIRARAFQDRLRPGRGSGPARVTTLLESRA